MKKTLNISIIGMMVFSAALLFGDCTRAEGSEQTVLKGIVYSHMGLPAAEVSVRVIGDAFAAQTTTGQDGTYEIEDCPIGKRLLVVVEKRGWRIHSEEIIIWQQAAEVSYDVNLQAHIVQEIGAVQELEEGADTLVNGFVYDDMPQPVESATVTISGDDFSAQAMTDKTGMYTMPSKVPLGELFTLVCEKEGFKVFSIEMIIWWLTPEFSYTVNLEPLQVRELGKKSEVNTEAATDTADRPVVKSPAIPTEGLNIEVTSFKINGKDVTAGPTLNPGVQEIEIIITNTGSEDTPEVTINLMRNGTSLIPGFKIPSIATGKASLKTKKAWMNNDILLSETAGFPEGYEDKDMSNNSLKRPDHI